MKLRIVTPERTVFEGEVDLVNAETIDGSIGIKKRHVALVTPLRPGILEFNRGNGEKSVAAVMGGMLSTDGEEVTVLTDAAELSDEIDRVRAEEAKKRAESLRKENNDKVDTLRAEEALTRALTRLKAIR